MVEFSPVLRPSEFEQMNAGGADFFDSWCRTIEGGPWFPFWDGHMAAVAGASSRPRVTSMRTKSSAACAATGSAGIRSARIFASRRTWKMPSMSGCPSARRLLPIPSLFRNCFSGLSE